MSTILTKKQIAAEVLRTLRRPWTQLTLISPFLTDFEFSNRASFFKYLEWHRKSGTEVTIVTTPSSLEVVESLLPTGVNVFVQRDLHAKLILAHNHFGSRFLLGSSNLTWSGMHRNLELAVLSTEPRLVSKLGWAIRSFLESSKRYRGNGIHFVAAERSVG